MATNDIEFGCPGCGEPMQPMKTKNKYKCSACKIKVEQLTIFSVDKTPKRGERYEGGASK